jgi:hypothetical protein
VGGAVDDFRLRPQVQQLHVGWHESPPQASITRSIARRKLGFIERDLGSEPTAIPRASSTAALIRGCEPR